MDLQEVIRLAAAMGNDVTIDGLRYYITDKVEVKCVDKGIKKAEILNGVESIPDSAFSKCKKLKEVKIPDSVTQIGSFVFSECKTS